MLVGKMQMNVEVNLAPDDGEGSPDEIRIEIEGPDAGRIIGKKGNVLDAHPVPDGARRRAARASRGGTSSSTPRATARATRTSSRRWRAASPSAWPTEGKVITFDPMSARERRIVHMALRDIKGVRTESMGEEPQRRVQIIPEKAAL